MNLDPFESKLRNQPLRPVPPEWRQEILHTANTVTKRASTPERSAYTVAALFASLKSQLTALLWPAPKAWAGLAVLWVAMFLINHAMSPNRASGTLQLQSASSMSAWREQERLLTELLEPSGPAVTARPRPAPARPHSEGRRQFLMV